MGLRVGADDDVDTAVEVRASDAALFTMTKNENDHSRDDEE